MMLIIVFAFVLPWFPVSDMRDVTSSGEGWADVLDVAHHLVLPAATLFGAAFLVLCDLAARTLMAPLEIPVGIITALIGGPFFLWLILRARNPWS